jgi:riboflavin kinase/FMN adenylyltransferase
VLDAARTLARARGTPLGVVTFEPHPREVLQPDHAPARLTPLRRKAELLRDLGVDVLYLLHFNAALMRLSAEAFVETILLDGLGAKGIVAGEDFRFGHRRSGSMALMERLAGERDVAVVTVPPLEVEGAVCSSTRIRAALADGEVSLAGKLLGYTYALDGVVRPGDRRGRTLGFPTANVAPLGTRPLLPAVGVYAVRAGRRTDAGMTWHPAVANFGRRPTVDGRSLLLEVHLLEGGGDLYGQRLRVVFVERLRGETRFEGLDQLRAQIAIDCERARAVHSLLAA